MHRKAEAGARDTRARAHAHTQRHRHRHRHTDTVASRRRGTQRVVRRSLRRRAYLTSESRPSHVRVTGRTPRASRSQPPGRVSGRPGPQAPVTAAGRLEDALARPGRDIRTAARAGPGRGRVRTARGPGRGAAGGRKCGTRASWRSAERRGGGSAERLVGEARLRGEAERLGGEARRRGLARPRPRRLLPGSPAAGAKSAILSDIAAERPRLGRGEEASGRSR